MLFLRWSYYQDTYLDWRLLSHNMPQCVHESGTIRSSDCAPPVEESCPIGTVRGDGDATNQVEVLTEHLSRNARLI